MTPVTESLVDAKDEASRASPPDRRMGHAGAIFRGDRGSYASTRQALEAAGAIVLDTPSQIGPALAELV